MTAALLLVVVLLPVVLAAGLARPGWIPAVRRLSTVAPALALLAAALPDTAGRLEAVLLGLEWRHAGAGRLLLAVIAAVMLASSWLLWQRRASRGYLLCLLLTMTGAFGATLAADGATYYLFYSIASLAAYGLIAGPEPRRRAAARLYLVLALFGELLFLAAVILAAAGGAGALPGWLVFFGLGAKLGVIPLYVALPPAYRSAPSSGAAVLGGALTAAALLGWLRFLPLAGDRLSDMAPWLAGLGLAAAFLGAVLGLLQREAKAVLGYSTMSQVGIATAALALAASAGWRQGLPVLLLFGLYHSLTKAALLLGVDARPVAGRFLVLVVLSLALAGLPLTGGAFYKAWLEETARAEGGALGHWLGLVLPWTSAATLVLMSRFLWLARRPAARPADPAVPFLALAAAALLLPWAYLWLSHAHPQQIAFGLGHLRKIALPLLAAGIPVLWVWFRARQGRCGWRYWLPAGDLAVAVEAGLRWVSARPLRRPRLRLHWRGGMRGMVRRVEGQLLTVPVAGTVYLVLLMVIAWLSMAG